MVVEGLTVLSAQERGTAAQEVRHDADARHVVLHGETAAGLEVGDRERRVEQRVIDHLGDVGVREVHGRLPPL